MSFQVQDNRFITTLFANTLDARRKKAFNNVTKNIPFLAYMGSKRSRARNNDDMGKGVVLYTGGGKIRITLSFGKNPNIKWMAPYENFDVATSEEDTDAFEVMRKLGGSVQISGEDIDDNQGIHQIRSLVRRKADRLEQDFKEVLEQAFMAGRLTGTGDQLRRTSPILNGPNPLGFLIQKSGSLTANNDLIHEVGQVDQPLWVNQDMLGSAAAGVATYADFRRKFARVYNNTMPFSDTTPPDFGISDQFFYEFYESTLIPLQRFGPYGDSGTEESIGFRGLAYKEMLIFWSRDMVGYGGDANDDVSLTANENEAAVMLLNSGAIEQHVSRRVNMRMSDFETPVDQDAIYGKFLHRTQLITPQRRKLGVYYGIDTENITP